MYKYIKKFPVNNILCNQLRTGPNNYLTLDTSFGPRLTDQIRCNYASLSPTLSTNFFSLWNAPPPTLYPKRQCFTNANSSQPDILCKYYRLTQPRRSSSGTLGGRISKNSFRVCTQNRGYASFFKRIIKLFKPKPSKPPKCDSVKPCPRLSKSRTCAKPPPKIDFETAVKCKMETVQQASSDNYIQHMCPKGFEVGYKEKPPFTTEGGQFLEDRLCREMPEKRVQKLVAEHSVKQKKLEDLAELKQIEEMEKIKLLKSLPEFKTCIKSARKSSTAAQSDITHAGSHKNDPCAKVESSIQCDFKAKIVKAAPCSSTAQKATSCTELISGKMKKGVCAKPCLDPAEVEDATADKNKCRNTKICPAKDKLVEDPCRNLKPCAQQTEKVEAKIDPCRNIKPCGVAVKTKEETDDPCKSTGDKGKNRCGMVVRPCGSKYKPLKSPRERDDGGLDKDDCGSVEDLKPCIRVECKPLEKAKDDSCVGQKKSDICRNVKPCGSSKKSGKSDRCKQAKSSVSTEKKSDSCRNIKACASPKKSSEKSDPCANLKPCASRQKVQASDQCKNVKEKDPCGTGSMKKLQQESKGSDKDDCGSVDNLPPCPRLDCGGASSKKASKDPSNNPCDTASAKTSKGIQEDDCDSVENLPPCSRSDCGGSSKKESKDFCKTVEKSCGDKASESKAKMVTCSELKAKKEKSKQKTVCESPKKKDDNCKKPPKPPTGGGCSTSPKGFSPSSLGRGIKSDIVKFYNSRDRIAGTPSESDIFTAVEKFKLNKYNHDSIPEVDNDFGFVGMHGEHRVEAHSNLFKQCRLLNPYSTPKQRGDCGLNLGVSQLMGIMPGRTKFLCSQTMPNMIDHCSFSTRVPKVIIENKKAPAASQNRSDILKYRIPHSFSIQSVFFSEVKNNGGDAKSNGGDAKGEKTEEDPCKVEKKPCPVVPCCKKEKDQCVMASEPPKLAKICHLPKPEEPKPEAKKDKPNPCNFEQAVKAESKHKNFKDNICPFVFETTDVCPPKKQLCCFSKHEKPTMQGVDPCCRGIVGDVKALGCGFCKKYELLNTPPKTLPKPSVCKAAPCFTKVPKACPPQKSSDGCKSSVCKRAEISKCPKPKFKVEVQEKPKKKPVGTMRCSNAPCYQKKCGKKKPPPPPCPTPIKPPKLEDLPPSKKPCKKVKKPVDEKRMCAKPSKRRGDAAACNISVCDKDKNKAKELAEKKQREALARQKAYAELKHTDWKAVPIKGSNRWCKSPPVERNPKCENKELSKTLLPTKEEKYKSPRYKDGKGRGKCAKPCPSKHVRKMHSCPHFDKKKSINVESKSSLIIQRDYFENLASIIGEIPSETTTTEDTEDV